MADDIFGDESLFSEFEKDRGQQNIFINFELDESGCENRSRIVFKNAESDEEPTDDEDTEASIVVGNEKNGIAQDPSTNAQNVKKEEQQQGEEDEDATNDSAERDGPQSTTYQERFERNKYRQFARLIDSTRYVRDDQSPGVQVIFQNNMFARKYRAKIEQFVSSLTEYTSSADFSKPSTDLPTRGLKFLSCVDINDKLPAEKRTKHMWESHAIVGCAHFHHGFMVDPRGHPLDALGPEHLGAGDLWEIPKYLQVYDAVYPIDQEEEKTDGPPKPPAPPKESCFNCGGEHRLNDCKVPKDQNRIRTKRREHQEKAGNKRNKTSNLRYHKDPELDPKSTKAKVRAGEISQALREAMGLKPDQLPSYIYRMRLFGYPPGWLHEANKKGSALAMYDKDGNETNMRGESLEDGEVGIDTTTDPADTEGFDVDKIIEYPGFTVPVPLGFVDESATLGLPPIQPHQLKKTLVEDVVSKETAQKRRRDKEEAKHAKRAKQAEAMDDMEIEDEHEAPAPTITSTPTEAKKPEVTSPDDSNSVRSPTMDSLLQQQQQLVQELGSEDGEDSNTANENGNTISANVQSPGSGFTSPESSSKNASDPDYLRQQNFSFTSSLSLSKDYGTPILHRERSFKKIPADVKFSQGIEDHIPYENLPDSTGTFDKMKNLFKSIREKVKGSKKK